MLASASVLLAAGSASAQTAVDTDLDGRPDDVEGEGDIDGDGIPNIEDAHDFWVSGQVVDGVNGSVVWLIGSGDDAQINTPDDVVVGKVDGPDFRFENVNDGAYVVVAGVDPATTNLALRITASVEGAPVEGVTVGAAEPMADSGPTVDPELLVHEPSSSDDAAPAALALDDVDSGSTDPFLLVLVATAAFLFGVLLAYQFAHLPKFRRLPTNSVGR